MTAVWMFICVGAAGFAGASVGFVAGYRYGDKLRQVRRDVIEFQGETIEARKLADWRKDRNALRLKRSDGLPPEAPPEPGVPTMNLLESALPRRKANPRRWT